VAILGKNGSGKSTLLKIITGVASATKGEVEVEGRISAMLELTSGFDMELSGVENIYLRALAMGIPRDEIESKKQEIIEFADIGEHITQPVRTYSSGMKARLGFAVSVSVEPDILIIDEVLAVGDDVFKLKCIDKMEEFRQQGKTILFVSHSLFTVKAFCTRALWINEGKLMAYGDLGPVVMQYEDFLREERRKSKASTKYDEGKALDKSDVVKIKGFRMFNDKGESTDEFQHGEDLLFSFEYEVKRPVDKLAFCFTVRNAEYMEVFMSNKQNADNVIASEVGTHKLVARLRQPNLLAGTYALSGELWNNEAGFYVSYSNKRPFQVVQDEFVGTGIVRIDYEFQND
jgi:teichoic acid transport system ATP-binding protein